MPIVYLLIYMMFPIQEDKFIRDRLDKVINYYKSTESYQSAVMFFHNIFDLQRALFSIFGTSFLTTIVFSMKSNSPVPFIAGFGAILWILFYLFLREIFYLKSNVLPTGFYNEKKKLFGQFELTWKQYFIFLRGLPYFDFIGNRTFEIFIHSRDKRCN